MTESVFRGRSLLSTRDYAKDELMYLIGFAEHLKDLKKRGVEHRYLAGKNIALLFEKTSTRTRAAFATACIDLGAHPEYLGKNDIQLGKKETVRDTALVLGSMFDGIESADLRRSTSRIWRSTAACRCGTASPTRSIPPRCWPTS